MSIFRSVLNFFSEIILGCSHSRLTRPFTLQDETYKVCLDCGTHVYYSSATLRPLSGREVRRMKAARAGEVKILPANHNGPALVPATKRKSTAA